MPLPGPSTLGKAWSQSVSLFSCTLVLSNELSLETFLRKDLHVEQLMHMLLFWKPHVQHILLFWNGIWFKFVSIQRSLAGRTYVKVQKVLYTVKFFFFFFFLLLPLMAQRRENDKTYSLCHNSRTFAHMNKLTRQLVQKTPFFLFTLDSADLL